MQLDAFQSPAFILDERRLIQNLELLQRVQREAGVDIILALKGFAMWRVFPLVKQYLGGATASSLYEARLIYEEMGCKAHTYAVAYFERDFDEMLRYSSHITFNSVAQYRRYQARLEAWPEHVSPAIRVNPEFSQVEVDLYNPAAPGSRLGEVETAFESGYPEGLEGMHFHVLCESSSYDLEQVLQVFEQKFGRFLPQLQWLNLGGGHLMTREGYDIEHLIQVLRGLRSRYPNLEIILEPGSAIAWDTGVLLATVQDIHESRGIRTAILDVSFTAHMPDTLEMPYRPRIRGASEPVPGKHHYRLGGVSCLSGDYMAEYSFDEPLQVGQRLVLEDMIHYTIVKTTMFNGVQHPDIAIWRANGSPEIVRRFTYEDYRNRLS